MTKLLKILTFCVSFVFILTSCNSSQDDTSSFIYQYSTTDPYFVLDLDFSNLDDISNYLETTSSNDETYIDGLINIISSNDLYANKSYVEIVEQDLYDYGQNDDYENNVSNLDEGNYQISYIYDITRDNDSYSVSGNLQYHSVTYYQGSSGLSLSSITSITDGVYSVSVDTTNYRIVQSYDYGVDSLNSENVSYLTNTNLYNALNLTESEDYYALYVNELESGFYTSQDRSLVYDSTTKEATLSLNLSTTYEVGDEMEQTLIYTVSLVYQISDGMITTIEYKNNIDATYVYNDVTYTKPLKIHTITNSLSFN